MDINQVKQLIELLESSKISEIELKEGETTIRVSRQATSLKPLFSTSGESDRLSPPNLEFPSDSLATSPAASQAPSAATSSNKEYTVTSPMVGTFYRATSPSEPPLVDLNDSIKEDAPLCIIEAMKMMNQITSEKAGVLKAILVENGQPVEFGQPLFTIQLAK